MLFLIRGLPSSGKSTLAEKVALGGNTCEADDYFYDEDGNYNFDPSKLKDAHTYCQKACYGLLQIGQETVVANTFTTRWEMQAYLDMAKEFDVKVTVIDLFDGGLTDEELAARNTHGVPLEAFANMRSRYEHDWSNGNPTPPWNR